MLFGMLQFRQSMVKVYGDSLWRQSMGSSQSEWSPPVYVHLSTQPHEVLCVPRQPKNPMKTVRLIRRCCVGIWRQLHYTC